MTIKELITNLQNFQTKHGNLEVECEYWCPECEDTHEGKGFTLEKTFNNELRLRAVHLGDDE